MVGSCTRYVGEALDAQVLIPGLRVQDLLGRTPKDERKVSTSVLLTFLMLVRAARRTDMWSLSTRSRMASGDLCSYTLNVVRYIAHSSGLQIKVVRPVS